MLERAGAARGDNRQVHGRGDRAGHSQFKAIAGAVAIHAGQQNLPGAERRHAPRPLHCIDTRGVAATVGKNLVAGPGVGIGHAFGVNRHHDALGAKALRGAAHQIRIADCGGVDAHLVGARVEQAANILDAADAAAHGQRDKHLARYGLDRLYRGVAAFVAGADIQQSNLVRALFVVARRDLDGVSRIADAGEVDALHHAPLVDVQAGNDAPRQTHQAPISSQ